MPLTTLRIRRCGRCTHTSGICQGNLLGRGGSLANIPAERKTTHDQLRRPQILSARPTYLAGKSSVTFRTRALLDLVRSVAACATRRCSFQVNVGNPKMTARG